MREILFRAKRIDNGEWVNGYYVYDYAHNAHFIFKNQLVCPNCINDRRVDYSVCDYEINTETLCQYTGLKDKNGNRIWENDIVRCNRREKEAKYKVVWDKTYADFRIEKLNGLGVMPICIEEGNVPVFGRHYECIGNIFDNPELLKGE